MLTLDLVRLEKEGSLRLQATIPADDPLLEETGLRFETALAVDLRASRLGSGEYLVRGTLEGAVAQECRRCLKPVRVPVDEQVTFLFAPRDALGDEEDPDVRPLDPSADRVDLGGPIREELVLTVPAYSECAPDCRGLCPRCGKDLNVETCQCVTDEADPRWDALRALKTD